MKWILIFVLYAHTPDGSNASSGSVSATVTQMLFDDETACVSARNGLNSGAFSKSFSNAYKRDSTVTSEAACVPQASTNGRGPIR